MQDSGSSIIVYFIGTKGYTYEKVTLPYAFNGVVRLDVEYTKILEAAGFLHRY